MNNFTEEQFESRLADFKAHIEEIVDSRLKEREDELFKRDMDLKNSVWDIWEKNKEMSMALTNSLDRFEGKWVRLDRTVSGLTKRMAKLISEYYSLSEKINRLDNKARTYQGKYDNNYT